MDESKEKHEKHIKHIKHLVFSGGGPAGLITYGAAKYLAKQQVWSLHNITTIYGCSVGAYFGVIVSLGYEWEWLDDYIIKRPWNKIITITAQTFFDAFSQKGLLGEKLLLASLKPLLEAKDLNEHCTLQELYEFNHIDIHMYTTNINGLRLEKVDLSHTTHPNLSIITALCMSTSYPLAFKPVCIDDDCFIDGGLLNNFPLNDCLIDTGCCEDEVLAFKHSWIQAEPYKVTAESSIIDYMILLTKKMQGEICTENKQMVIKNIVSCDVEGLSNLSDWATAIATEDMRAALIAKGEAEGKRFGLQQCNSACSNSACGPCKIAWNCST
jgi:predicted acylesterase/phospholipase RssA